MPRAYIVLVPDHGYLIKDGGWNLYTRDPREATAFETRDAARDARPGHHKDMGGNGFKGTVCLYETEIRNFRATQETRERYSR